MRFTRKLDAIQTKPLTRVDEEGVPMPVQDWSYSPGGSTFELLLFNGITIPIPTDAVRGWENFQHIKSGAVKDLTAFDSDMIDYYMAHLVTFYI